jgi:3',5'-cyclic AMP phosphodiesterase CpdA
MRILHISDLHFGRTTTGSAHMFHAGGVPTPEYLAKLLLKAQAPDLVVISGDIGWSGVEEDYSYAETFVNTLRTTWPNVPLAIAPGNHDVNWKAEPGKHQQPYLEFLQRVYGSSFHDVYPFVSARPGDRNYVVGIQNVETPTTSATVVTVNSAARQETAGKPVYVDSDVLGAIRDRLGAGSPSRLRIFVLHHHLLPFIEPNYGDTIDTLALPETDPTIVANSAEIQKWLEKTGFHVVLHGHKHRPHGRRDTLWSSSSSSGRRLFIIGAGSAGVMKRERAGGEDPLSVNNILALPSAEETWHVSVSVTRLSEDRSSITEEEEFRYRGAVGPRSGRVRHFHAEDTATCHRLIRDDCPPDALLMNFISVVDSSEYVHPPTALRNGEPASEEDVRQSYLTLHPEVNAVGTFDMSNIDDSPPPRDAFRFEHGRRLFDKVQAGPDALVRPFDRAIDSIGAGASHAYVGLYRPAIDAAKQPREPLPCLVGLQFVPDGLFLDAVATFRKLELSFWWPVNMYEVAQLLQLAAKRDPEKRRPRRITFFAALAQWKTRTEVAVTPEIDRLTTSELVPLALRAAQRDDAACGRLASLLLEKQKFTDEKNLDDGGLERLFDVTTGVANSGITTLAEFIAALRAALETIRTAVRLPNPDRQEFADRALQALSTAAAAIRAVGTSEAPPS